MIRAYIGKDNSCEIELKGWCGDVLKELAIMTTQICQSVANNTGDNFENVFKQVRKYVEIQHLHDKIQNIDVDNVNNPSSLFDILQKAMKELEN